MEVMCMLEIFIRNKEMLNLFREALQDAGLEVRSRKFLGFRLRPESAVVEISNKNLAAVVRTIAVQAARNPDGIIEFREYFSNNSCNWVVGPVAAAEKVKSKPVGKK